MSVYVSQIPEPAVGTSVTILGQHGKLVLLSAPDPDGRRRTVHGRAPDGVSLHQLRLPAREGRLRFSGPWWNQTIEMAPPTPRRAGRRG